jgi:DNA polymerase III delta prime subunit
MFNPVSSGTSILLICPDLHNIQQQVVTFLEQQRMLATSASIENNPDLHCVNTPEDNITIEAVRQLNQDVLLKPYTADISIFVIFNIDLGSVAAQNALLKIVEEPPVHTQLILTATTISQVLPTIQSRCNVRKTPEVNIPVPTEDTYYNYKEILTQLTTFTDILTLSEKYKERSEALSFVRGAINFLHSAKNTHNSKTLSHLQHLVTAEELLRKNVNVRLVIEDCFFHFLR